MERRTTSRNARGSMAFRCIVLALLAVAAAATAHADYYTVTLTNGTSFQTRYRPVPAEWDDNVVMINTDRGNWIGLYADEVADVVSHAEATGFGYQLDTTTLFVGWSPNDLIEDEEAAKDKEAGPDLEQMFPEPEPSGVVEQFVDIPIDGSVAGQPIQ
jgi:hypothetical protein